MYRMVKGFQCVNIESKSLKTHMRYLEYFPVSSSISNLFYEGTDPKEEVVCPGFAMNLIHWDPLGMWEPITHHNLAVSCMYKITSPL